MTYWGSDINPRFPHTLRVLRCAADSLGVPITDENGNPKEDVIYESSFGYRSQTLGTTTSGSVVKADYKIAMPKTTADIRTGDILEVTDYTRSYRGVVVKYITFNLGTNIWFDEVKN